MTPVETQASLPHRLLAFYGDDFTGSTDVMEVVSMAGLSAVLFLEPPDDAWLARFPEARVIGIAGIGRSQTPAWMDAHLPAIYRSLRTTGAPFVHYKVCSTFDSAPDIGNIGHAARLGMREFANRPVPLLVGVPALQRYVAFGNLFAGSGAARYRIDRHPVMSRHPVTPMHEADLRMHLAAQTDLTVGLLDLTALAAMSAAQADRVVAADRAHDLLLFDTVDEASLRQVGGLVWSLAADTPSFAVGSSGFEYALVSAWHAAGLLPPAPVVAGAAPVERLFVVSGSCSPVNDAQIGHALRSGFSGLHVDPLTLVGGGEGVDDVVRQSLALLSEGRDVLLYTADGAQDSTQRPPDNDRAGFNDRLGSALGDILREVLRRSGLKRAVVAGGDTSSHATRQLGLHALTFRAPLAPGSPLCLAHGDDPALTGLELALKGGQMGREEFFLRAKLGAAAPA